MDVDMLHVHVNMDGCLSICGVILTKALQKRPLTRMHIAHLGKCYKCRGLFFLFVDTCTGVPGQTAMWKRCGMQFRARGWSYFAENFVPRSIYAEGRKYRPLR